MLALKKAGSKKQEAEHSPIKIRYFESSDCFQTRRSPLTPLKKGGKETLKASLTPLVKARKKTLKAPLTLVKAKKETLKAPLKKGGWGDLQRLRCFKKGLKTHSSGLGHFPHNVRG